MGWAGVMSMRTGISPMESQSRNRRDRIRKPYACGGAAIRAESSKAMEKAGVKIERNPDESRLQQLGVRDWPRHPFLLDFFLFAFGSLLVLRLINSINRWGCPPSKFPWTYSAKETCYLLEGKVKVFPDGSDDCVEISAGDLVVFPKGMSCTWDVSVAVDKHYKFD